MFVVWILELNFCKQTGNTLIVILILPKQTTLALYKLILKYITPGIRFCKKPGNNLFVIQIRPVKPMLALYGLILKSTKPGLRCSLLELNLCKKTGIT